MSKWGLIINLVPLIVQEGFRYHHAEPDYLMLVYWIPKTPDTIPANASHTVGIGAFVMNSNSEVVLLHLLLSLSLLFVFGKKGGGGEKVYFHNQEVKQLASY